MFNFKQNNNKVFGEGCTIVEINGLRRIFQLTWLSRFVYEYDADNFSLLRIIELPYQISEGWGLTSTIIKNELKLIISDGSNKLYIVDPLTWLVEKTIHVKKPNKQPLKNLNEIEMYKGKLLANVYLSTYIAVINIDTGKMERFLLLIFW